MSGSAVWIGLALGLRHALDADHLVAVTGMLSSGRRARSVLVVGVFWGLGHALTLSAAGAMVLASGWHFPESWSVSLEALVGAVIMLLGINLLDGYRRGRVRWEQHTHGDRSHTHLRFSAGGADPTRAPTGGVVGEHGHEGPGRLVACAIGALHGLAGSSALVIVLALSFADPADRYAALLASALASMAGMVLVTAAAAIPYALSRGAAVWQARLQLITGIGSVAYGCGFAIHALARL